MVLYPICISIISIHALREEGDPGPRLVLRCSRAISIHALREEGDPARAAEPPFCKQFLSTPSARRATSTAPPSVSNTMYFYPRPPRGGRHAGHRCRPED